MRIVRFIELFEGLPEEHMTPRWGLVLDQVVYRLLSAPYMRPLHDGLYAPQITGTPVALASVKLLAPVRPRKIVCVGRNYAEHAAELGNQVPTEPLIFLKPPTTIIGPGDAIVYPDLSKSVHHEGELALVIGSRCRYVSAAEATKVMGCVVMKLEYWFGNEGGSLLQNLRTVVLDPQRRIYRQFDGNKWKANDLAEALVEAAAKR